MVKDISPDAYSLVINALMISGVRKATKYLSSDFVIHATWRFKPRENAKRREIVVTFGAPNYDDKSYIRRVKRSGETFPITNIRLIKWQKKK